MFTTDTLLDPSGLPERTRKDVPRIVNRLLGQTFLYQDVEADKDDYYTVFRHRPVFEAALGLAGFTLLHDDYHRIFQVVSDYSYCRMRHKLDESLMIVVLRKLYEEQAEQLRLATDPVVTVGEVREEYRTITGKERDLGVIQYETLLRRLRKLGLIDTLDGRTINVRDSEARLRLRGSLKLILPVQTADEMEAWVKRYRAGGSGSRWRRGGVAMKQLTRIRLVNWHLFADTTITCQGTTYFIGVNGAGKSTILDAVQFALVGGQRDVKFNQAAMAESRRTLSSYVRGELGTEGQRYLRGDCTGLVALEFANPDGTRFVHGALVDAYADNHSPDITYFIVHNAELNDAWFFKTAGQLFDTGSFRRHLEHFALPTGAKAQTFTRLEDYRANLLNRLGQLRDTFPAKIVKGVAFSPLTNIRDFVHNYLLDEALVDVKTLQEQLETLRHFETLVADIVARIAELDRIEEHDAERIANRRRRITNGFVKRQAEADRHPGRPQAPPAGTRRGRPGPQARRTGPRRAGGKPQAGPGDAAPGADRAADRPHRRSPGRAPGRHRRGRNRPRRPATPRGRALRRAGRGSRRHAHPARPAPGRWPGGAAELETSSCAAALLVAQAAEQASLPVRGCAGRECRAS